MASENSPDWLPSGWTMRLKANESGRKVKCYIDPASGRKFYSKSQVSRYLETLNSCSTPQRGISSIDNIVEERNESPEWLPHGWTVESKTRNSGAQIGKKFKIYIEPATGYKFYSKPEVSRYLKKISSGTAPQMGIGYVNDHSIDHSTGGGTSLKPDVSQNFKTNKSSISEQKSSISKQKKLHGVKHSMNNVVVESVSVRELPPGWITEIRSRKNVDPKHKDLYYTDPVSGYVFRSKPDALRFLETGDINRCKIKPKKRDTSDLVSLNNGISQSMDHSTEDGTSSKPDVSQSCKTNKSSLTKQKKLHGGKHLTNNVVIERVSDDEFPAGWIKEIITRKIVDRIHKDSHYTDPISGYKFFSKTDALRYLKTGDINSCKIKPKKKEINDLELINDEDVSHSMDHLTVGGTSSNPDVSQNCKTDDSSIPKQKKLYGGKHLVNDVVVERVSSDEFPPGWVKEIRTRNVGNRIQKDPYYKDPVSGYVFRSKMDALRYLETGDINSCKMKPKKRDINDLELINDGDISHSMDHLTVGGTSSNPDISQNCKTDDSSLPKQKKLYGGKHSVKNVVVEKVSADEFPPGWIKEIRTRNVGNRIQKDPYYKDPVSGYVFRSKPDALRYLETGDINSCKMKPKKRNVNDLELINDGDISHSMDHLTVGGTSSNPDVSQNCKKDDSSIPKQKKLYGGKHLVNDVVVERVSSDEFPPGWIKEIRTRNVGNRIQKDPYYKDPVSGYVFRSKPDALRYLETGDINSCKMKPKKRSINDLELNNEDISLSSAVVRKKLNTTTRRLRVGKERIDIGLSSSLVASEVGNPKGRRVNVSDATLDISSPTVGIPEAKQTKESSVAMRKDSEREESMKVSAANEIISSVINDILQEEKLSENGTQKHSSRKAQSSIKSKNKRTLSLPFRASKRLAGLKPEMQPDNSIITEALPAAAIDGGETVANPVSDLTLNASDHKVPQQLEAEAKRRVSHDASTFHIESSNRSGRRLEDQSVLEKQPGREEAEKQNDDKPENETAHHAFISRETIIDVVSLNKRVKELQEAFPEKQPRMEEAEKHNDDKPEKEAANHASISRETILDVTSSNKREKELLEAVPEKQPGRQVTRKQNDDRPESQEPPLDYPFMDSWTDPCLEFAFKTLTGAIPVEENLSFHDYFQADALQTQKNGGLKHPESVPPSITQNDVTSHFEATEKSVPAQQLPANPTYLSPADVGLPSCSIINPQQSSLDAGNNEHQTKVN